MYYYFNLEETSHEFKKLEQETETRRECLERMQSTLELFHRHISKKKESPDDKHSVKSPMAYLSAAMLVYGSILPQDSAYGKALLATGQTHDQLANELSEFVKKKE